MLGIEVAARAGRFRLSAALTASADEPTSPPAPAPPQPPHVEQAGEATTELAAPRQVGFGVPWEDRRGATPRT